MTAAVQVRSLVYRYGAVTAVDDVTFDVAVGEVFGILGPNGAGKTTTLECVLGLRSPAAGTVSVGGFDVVADPGAVRGILGAQLQSTQLQDKLTPRQAIGFFRSFYRKGLPVDQLLTRFGLEQKADETFDSLSAGQRQRVGLALAFVNDPSVVILDEPTAGLDPGARRDLHVLIRALKAEGRTVLLSTHYVDEAAALCDRVAVIAAGRLVRVGTPAELVKSTAGRVCLVFQTHPVTTADRWADLAAATKIEAVDGGLQIETDDLTATTAAVVERVRLLGVKLVEVRTVRPTLEQAVLDLSEAERGAKS
jgi:ABC-2 type transport system ATP-binding protein